VGEQLRAARTQMGLSLDAVAKHLKLAPRQVSALESDDVAQLPSGPFLRGFIRNYARLVNLDPEALLGQDHTRRMAVQPLDAAPPNRGELREGSVRADGNILKWVIPLGLIAALLAGATWYETRRTKTRVSTDTSVAVPATVAAPAAPSTEPAATTAAPVPILPTPNTASASENTVSVPTAQPPIGAATTPIASTLPATAPPSAAPVAPLAAVVLAPNSATKGVTLQLNFGEQAWTEIRDGDGNVLTSKTHAKGTTISVSGQPPFRFAIGNARNVVLTRDGAPVDLSPRIGAGDVAKFTLQ
jgi:cytoskeleton protein RodZ